MGHYRTKEEIVRGAISEISSIPSPTSTAYISPEESNMLDRLNLIIAEQMEKTIYPFALFYLELSNPTEDTNLDPEDDNSIYNKPAIASEIGVYRKNELPGVADIVIDTDNAKASSIDYYFFGNRLVVSGKPSEDNPYFLVYTTNDPPVADMSSTFQRFLIFQLAAENFFRTGTNSRLAALLFKQASDKRSAAEKLVIDSATSFRKNYKTVSSIIYAGSPDGRA